MTDNTADPQEISKFNHLADTWWNPQGPMWPLHRLNQFRLVLILNALAREGRIDRDDPKPLSGLTALDIGCGGGLLSESLAQLGATVTGLDMAERNVMIARQHASTQNLSIEYRHAEVSTVQQQYDLVFNLEVVEHVADLNAFMKASCRTLAPGGTLFLSTINRTLKSFFFAILGAEYVLRLLPKGTHQWHKFVRPDELTWLLNHHGLDSFWQTGVSLNPLSRQYSTTPSLAVNYMLAAKHY